MGPTPYGPTPENPEPTGSRYLADTWTQRKPDASTGEDHELDYLGLCPWLSVAPAEEQEAEQRPTRLSGPREIRPRSGGYEQARNA